ncbi:hypothetical protein SMICM304S_02125 [Streptomyces microflavus]
MHRTLASTLERSTSSNCASLIRARLSPENTRPEWMTPCTAPNRRTISSFAARRDARSVASHRRYSGAGPSAPVARAMAASTRASCGLRPSHTTWARYRRTRYSLMTEPRPPAPPMMTYVPPCRSRDDVGEAG